MIQDERDRRKDLDHLPVACVVDDKEFRIIRYGIFIPRLLEDMLRNTRVGRTVKIYCSSEDCKEEIRKEINNTNRDGYVVVRNSHEPSKSGFYYYNIPGDKNSLIVIEEDADNSLNLTARRISIAELLYNMEDNSLLLNQALGDKATLTLYQSYLNKYHNIVNKLNTSMEVK